MVRYVRAIPLFACTLIASALMGPAARAADAPTAAADRGVVEPRPGFRDALTAPLEDLNLKRTDVPDVLVRARASPYAVVGLDHCEAIAGEVGRLDAVLGPDQAEPPPPDSNPPHSKTASQVHAVAVEVAQDRAHALIPFRSWIRKLTGADRNAKELAAAIRAGEVRRGYLKGVGMRMNCAPPAAPSWFVPAKPVQARAAQPAEAPAWRRWWRDLVMEVRRLAAQVARFVRSIPARL